MSVTSAYGANIAFIEELYERYRTNPDAVSASWREFFHDYQPQLEEEAEEETSVAAAAPAARPVAPVPVPVPAPAAEAAAATPRPARPTAVPANQTVVPLRGAA